MKAFKILMAAVTVAAIVLPTAAAYAQDKGLIGVLMPTKTSQRWINDGDAVKSQLEAKGYTVDLQYAQDDIPTQLSQLENEITKAPVALIIASIDGTTLADALQKAADAGIVVVAYDRLIKGTANVDYYTTFDNFGVGVIQANSLLKGLGYPENKGPFNVELFGGSPDDNNAFFFYDGAMSVLQPLIDDGTLVIKSGQTGMEKVGTLRWLAATAQARMDNLLSAYYSDGTRVDGVLSPYDGLSRGIIESLRAVGYGTADQALADRYRPGRRDRIGQGDHRRRAVLDRVQGHARSGQGHRRTDRHRADGRHAGRPGHRDVQQRRQSGPLDPVDPVRRRPVELPGPRCRLGLHQGRRAAVSFRRKSGPASRRGPFRSTSRPVLSARFHRNCIPL